MTNKILEGMQEALAWARGDYSRVRLSTVDVRRQIELAKRETATWPQWMKDAAHFEGTDHER